jgi:phage replication-related protein YjqB (UPF0714/DUF867 family)
MPRNLESSLQIACVKWFRLQYPNALLFSIPNGGNRSVITAVTLKREGATAGIPDIQIAVARHGYHGLFIEMKAAKGRLSDNQKAVIPRLEAAGYKVAVCNSFEQFEQEVKGYLG